MQPVLLLWGADDPWIRPQSAERIRSLYPRAEKVLLPGVGHCPQVSTALLLFAERIQNVLMGLQAAQMDLMVPINTAKDPAYEPDVLGIDFVLQRGTATSAELHRCAQIYATALGQESAPLGVKGMKECQCAALLHDSKMQLCCWMQDDAPERVNEELLKWVATI